MPSVIDQAARTLRAVDSAVFDATEHTITVPAATDEGFLVRLRMVHDREFVVWYDQWQQTFDRAEDALDCFEYGLSDSCRLKITFRGDEPVGWLVEKREYGMWVPGQHPRKRRSLGFWRPTRIVYRQNQLFRRS
jgi:hypothetical protein